MRVRDPIVRLEGRMLDFSRERKGRGGTIEIADSGISAFAMFFTQSASFLAFRGAEP